MEEKSFLERYYSIIGYAIGSCFAEIIALPIYTIKTNYQTSNFSSITIIKNIYSKYGIFGFYNAVFSAIFARMVSSFIKYSLYNEIKYYRQTDNSDLFNNMVNGCISGVFCSFFVHPIDVITNHLQRFKNFDYNLIKIKVLYSGLTQTLIRNFLLYSVLFSVFDYSKYLTNNNIILSCVMTTTITSAILQPSDYIRTKFMAQQKEKIKFRTCWKGYHLSYIANTTHFTIAMYISYIFTNFYKNLSDISI
jgi:hypothetical protein